MSVYVRDTLVREVTTSSPEGCHITPSPPEKPYLSGGPDVVQLPVDIQRRVDECPPSPPSGLESGVLLWMGADGLYARRMCQSRVYWQGGPSVYGNKPNKLERDVVCKLLHTQDYLTGEISESVIRLNYKCSIFLIMILVWLLVFTHTGFKKTENYRFLFKLNTRGYVTETNVAFN